MQRWNVSDYEKNGRFVATLAGDVVDLLAPKSGESILDLGCGDGVLTREIGRLGANVTGVDSSVGFVDAAIERGVRARLLDGEHLDFYSEFDAVFSNAALHWMLNQDAVLSGVRKALKPSGRFVAEMGGHGNIAAIRTALQSVMADHGVDAEKSAHNVFFTVDEYADLLRSHNFRVESISLIPRPTLLPTGIAGWLRTFRSSLFDSLGEDAKGMAVERVSELLRPILCTRDGKWFADYVRLRFRAYAE
jgi:trans-aconitate methyltransferase